MAKKKEAAIDPAKNVELVERIASVTEELEDILAISEGKKMPWSHMDLKSIMKSSTKTTGTGIHPFIFSVFRLLALQGLVKGRMTLNAYSTGKSVGESLHAKTPKQVEKVMKKLGMGRVKISRFSEDNVKVKIYNDVTSLGIKGLKRPVCYFEAGFLAGLLERVTRKKIDLEETKCRAMHGKFCQFELFKASKKSLPRTSAPVLPADMYSQENIKLLTTLASHAITAIENALLFEKTKRQAVIDGLTQLYNHRYFQQTIKVEVKRAERHRASISLIMTDIDNFKRYNDTYGHPKGDEVLKAIARALQENVREIDVVARYGGDEMGIVLPQTGWNGARVVANRIRKSVAELDVVKKSKIKLSLSQGVASYNPKSKKVRRADELILKADRALLSAKKKGRGKIINADR